MLPQITRDPDGATRAERSAVNKVVCADAHEETGLSVTSTT